MKKLVYLLMLITSCASNNEEQFSDPNEVLQEYYLSIAEGDIDRAIELSITDESLKLIDFKGSKNDAENFLKIYYKAICSSQEAKLVYKNLANEMKSLVMKSFSEHEKLPSKINPNQFAMYFIKDYENSYYPLGNIKLNVKVSPSSVTVIKLSDGWVVANPLMFLRQNYDKAQKNKIELSEEKNTTKESPITENIPVWNKTKLDTINEISQEFAKGDIQKQQYWDDFWDSFNFFFEDFKKAVHSNDKNEVLKYTNSQNFYDGGGGGTASDFLDMFENWQDVLKKYINSDVYHEMGYVYTKSGLMFAPNNNGEWRWIGIMGG